MSEMGLIHGLVIKRARAGLVVLLNSLLELEPETALLIMFVDAD